MEYHNTVGIPLKVNEKKILQFCRIKSLVGKINKHLCVYYTGAYKKKVFMYKKMGYYKRGKISYDFK